MKSCIAVLLGCLSLVAAQNIPERLFNQEFSGNYARNQQDPLFNYLTVDRGNLDVYFVNRRNESTLLAAEANTIEFQMFNPKYQDGRSVVMTFGLNNFKQGADSTWSDKEVEMTVTLYNKGDYSHKQLCKGDYTVSVSSSDDNDASPKNLRVSLNITSNGQTGTCSFDFVAEVKYLNDQVAIILYSLFISILLLCQLTCSYRVIKGQSTGRIHANKLSLTTVTVCAIQDFYLTMLHVFFIMLQDYYMYFILPIFLLVIQSMFFDMKLVFIAWRAKYMTVGMTTAELRKKLTLFYVKFYLSLFSYLTIMYFFHFQIFALILQPVLIFTPQIVKNALRGNGPEFYKSYILGVLGLRAVLVLYLKGCPENIYRISPSAIFCVFWVLCFAAFTLVLLLQYRLGPRFFVPKRCIPGYYDYTFNYVIENVDDIPICAMCLNPVTVQLDEEEVVSPLGVNPSINDSFIQKGKSVEVMRTPCGHLFHYQCLKSWTDVKLECPSCRSVIPPLIQ